ncbi:MAG: DUF2793 domain-containing protein, partial [Gammaproteobacteria bacterium]
MANTENLNLPVVAASQAQKHVTVNESLYALDAIVQLAVIDKDLTSPPGSPTAGDRYIVGASSTGAWAGQDGNIAAYQNGTWEFYTPKSGWVVYVEDEGIQYLYLSGAWSSLNLSPDGIQDLELLGVNTTADATNRLSVSSPATLFTGEGAGHQLKINKAADTDTASLLFQSNLTGHAEMGLAGSTDFTIKTSSDGTSWFTALQCASANGMVSFPAGVSGRIEVFNTGNS